MANELVLTPMREKASFETKREESLKKHKKGSKRGEEGSHEEATAAAHQNFWIGQVPLPREPVRPSCLPSLHSHQLFLLPAQSSQARLLVQ